MPPRMPKACRTGEIKKLDHPNSAAARIAVGRRRQNLENTIQNPD